MTELPRDLPIVERDPPKRSVPPHLDGRSRRQARIVEALWAQYCQDRWVLVSGKELGLRANVKEPTRDVATARIKLRRIGWEIESYNGRNGGFRLVQWNGLR